MSLQKALELVTQAVSEDSAGNQENAFHLYSQAIREMELCLHIESDPSMRATLQEKLTEYKTRMRELQGMLALNGIMVEEKTESPGAGFIPPGMTSGSLSTSQMGVQTVSAVMDNVTPTEMRIRQENGLAIPASMTGSEAWRTAQQLTETGKAADMRKDFQKAFEYYRCSMAYFQRAINSDDVLTKEMKTTAKSQMMLYLERAEKIKAYLIRSGVQIDDGVDSTGGIAGSTDGRCAACGQPMTKVIYALERQWHPECFIAKVPCAYCHQPFSKIDLKFVVNKENGLPYHIQCHDNITGLSRECEKTFTAHKGAMFMKISLKERRCFRPGENVELSFVFDNTSSVKLNTVFVIIEVENAETSFSTSYKNTLDRNERVRKSQVMKIEHHFGDTLPMAEGSFTETMTFDIPPSIPPTVVGDAAMRREYFLKVIGQTSNLGSNIELVIPIIIKS